MESRTDVVVLVTLLSMFGLLHTVQSWDQRDVLEDIQDEISLLRDEVGSLNTKLNILLERAGGLELSLNSTREPDLFLPPLSLLNVSKEEADDGVKVVVWFQTYGRCDDVIVNWNVFDGRLRMLDELKRSCTSGTPNIGSSSAFVEKLESNPELRIATNNGSFGVKLRFNEGYKSNYTGGQLSTDEFFIEEFGTTKYHKGEPVVLNVLYKSSKGNSPELRLNVGTVEEDGKETWLYSKTCSVNPYNDGSDRCRLRKFRKQNSVFQFQIHIDTDLIEPTGVTTISTRIREEESPVFVTFYQKVGIHRDTQDDLYPEHFTSLNIDGSTLCNRDDSCYVRCEAIGNDPFNLELSEIKPDGSLQTIPAERIDDRPYSAIGLWLIIAPEESQSKTLLCSALFSDGLTDNATATVVFFDRPTILLNESYFNVDCQAGVGHAKCTARARTLPDIMLYAHDPTLPLGINPLRPSILRGLKTIQGNDTVVVESEFVVSCTDSYAKQISVVCWAETDNPTYRELYYDVHDQSEIGTSALLGTYDTTTWTKVNNASEAV